MDGSITIDTKIDQKGFKTGVKGIANAFKSLGNVIKGIGKALVGVFVGGAIINSIKGILGQFDFLKSSIGDKIKPLSDAWETLKGTFVNFIATALVPMIPYLVMAVQWFAKLLTTATQIIAALFGMKQTVGGIAAETKKTEKAAKGSLAAFDQISVLQQPDTGTGEDASMITPEAVTVADDLLAKVQAIKDAIMEWWDDPIGKIKETWGKIVTWFVENVITPIWEWWSNTWLGKIVNSLLGVFLDTWQKIVDNTIETFNAVKEKVMLVLTGIKEFITGVLTGDWALAWKGLQDIVTGVFGAIFEFVKGMLENLSILFTGLGEAISIVLKPIFEALADVFSSLREKFANALDWIHDKFVIVFSGIANFVKGIINTIIGFINSLIQSIGTGINAIIYSANVVGSVIPGFTPIEFVSVPQIPKLATGAVIPPNAEFAAILGDQTRGRNIEAPEDLIRQIIREEMAGASGDVTVPFTIELDGEVIYKSVKRASTRHGKSLIAGGAA